MYIDHCREPKANYLNASPVLHALIKSHHSNPQPQKLSMVATHLINSVDNTKLPWNALPWMEHISFFRNSPSLVTPFPQVTRLITLAFFMSWSIISSPLPPKKHPLAKCFVCLPSQAREWPVNCPELINLYFEPNQTKQNLIYSSIIQNYFGLHEWRWKRNPTNKYFMLKHR